MVKEPKKEKGSSYIEKVGNSTSWYKFRGDGSDRFFFLDMREVEGIFFQNRKHEEQTDNEYELYLIEVSIVYKSGNKKKYVIDTVFIRKHEYQTEDNNGNPFIEAMTARVYRDLEATEKHLKEILEKLP